MTTYSDGLSQIRENIEWFLQSSKKDDTPTNKMGLSVDVKDIEEATALSGLSPTYLVGDRQTYRASKKDIPVEKPKEKPRSIMDRPPMSFLQKEKPDLIPQDFVEQQSLDNWVMAFQKNQTEPTATNEVQSSVFTDKILAKNEGVEASDVVTGIKTQSYGVVHSKGLNRKDFNTNKAFAAAVVQKHYEELDNKFTAGGHNLKEAPKSVQYAFLDLHYNNGNVGDHTVSLFDKNDMSKSLNNTLEFVGTKTSKGERIALPSLASRRVRMYNDAAEELKKSKIYSVDMTTVKGGTNVEYRDVNDNLIHSFIHSRALANVSNKGVSTKRKSATWNRVTDKWTYQ